MDRGRFLATFQELSDTVFALSKHSYFYFSIVISLTLLHSLTAIVSIYFHNLSTSLYASFRLSLPLSIFFPFYIRLSHLSFEDYIALSILFHFSPSYIPII